MKINISSIIIYILYFFIGYFIGYILWPKIHNFILYKKENSFFVEPLHNNIVENSLGKIYSIKRIKVINGDYFDITFFENKEEKRILGKLSVLATEDSKIKVINLMNHCTQPKVTILSKDNEGHWIVEIDFIHEGKKINLSKWLTQNGLIYE